MRNRICSLMMRSSFTMFKSYNPRVQLDFKFIFESMIPLMSLNISHSQEVRRGSYAATSQVSTHFICWHRCGACLLMNAAQAYVAYVLLSNFSFGGHPKKIKLTASLCHHDNTSFHIEIVANLLRWLSLITCWGLYMVYKPRSPFVHGVVTRKTTTIKDKVSKRLYNSSCIRKRSWARKLEHRSSMKKVMWQARMEITPHCHVNTTLTTIVIKLATMRGTVTIKAWRKWLVIKRECKDIWMYGDKSR